jgi:hypothetical protein
MIGIMLEGKISVFVSILVFLELDVALSTITMHNGEQGVI